MLFQVEILHCTVSDDLRGSFEFFTLEGHMRGERRIEEWREKREERREDRREGRKEEGKGG